MAWYDNGLQGTYAYPTSSGLNMPLYEYGNHSLNVSSPIIIDSFALNTGVASGGHYDYALNTFSMGTQLCIHAEVSAVEVDWFSTMCPYVTRYMDHTITLQLKNGDTVMNIGSTHLSYLTSYYSGGAAPAGMEFSIYGFLYVYTNGYPTNSPGTCFPYGGSNAGTNSSILCVVNNGYIEFYLAGYPVSYPAGDFQCPVLLCGRISPSTLNDPKWFDPTQDAYVASEGSSGGYGEGGNVPSLPVSPSYPGTDMTFPSLPTGASAFGFSRLNLFKPSAAQLADALDILYSDADESTLETIIESCKKWWYKPEQYCISLMISPVDATTAGSKNIKFGKYDSEVSAPYVSSQWQVTDCGSIDVPLKYGSFLDFEPHAKLKIYLPYIGFRTLNANEVIGGNVAIKYYTDILSGVSVCMMLVTRSGSNNSILYTYDCNVNMQVPLTSENYNTVISQLLSAGVAAGVAATTGGMGLAALGTMSAIGGATSAMSAAGSPDLTQSGNLSPNSGVLSHPKPYICVQMPIPTTPTNFVAEKGKPSNIYMALKRCSGKTVINDIHLDISGATDYEIDQIRQAFKRGVYM